MVSEHLAVARQDGPVTFFDASGPIFICDAHDEGSLRFAAVMLTNPVLGLDPRRVRWPRSWAGIEVGVHEYPSGIKTVARRRWTSGVVDRAARPSSKAVCSPVRRPASTWAHPVAKLVGVNEKTIRNAVTEGRLLRTKQAADDPHRVSDEATEHATSSVVTRMPCRAGGVATTREAERALAPTGLLVEALAEFEPAESVAKAGVLVALPALLGQGLDEVGQQLYGTSEARILRLDLDAAELRPDGPGAIKSPEGLTTHAPGFQFGRVLGLDRAPETKTARRKRSPARGHLRWSFRAPSPSAGPRRPRTR